MGNAFTQRSFFKADVVAFDKPQKEGRHVMRAQHSDWFQNMTEDELGPNKTSQVAVTQSGQQRLFCVPESQLPLEILLERETTPHFTSVGQQVAAKFGNRFHLVRMGPRVSDIGARIADGFSFTELPFGSYGGPLVNWKGRNKFQRYTMSRRRCGSDFRTTDARFVRCCFL